MHSNDRLSTPLIDDGVVAMAKNLTRAEQRDDQRAPVPDAGPYGIDATDAGADSWRARFVIFAHSPEDAQARIRDAGFHKKQIHARWTPNHTPPEGLPAALGPDSRHWLRSRLDDAGWTPWVILAADYRHPSQAQAAADPSVR